MNVTVTVSVARLRYTYCLVPAMHTRNRVRMHREGDILMYAGIRPPYALAVGVGTRVRLDTVLTLHVPLASLVIKCHGCHQLPLATCVELPAPHVMAAGDHAGTNAFCHPRFNDKVPDLGFDTD